jgi:hypothetical protein
MVEDVLSEFQQGEVTDTGRVGEEGFRTEELRVDLFRDGVQAQRVQVLQEFAETQLMKGFCESDETIAIVLREKDALVR